jgi:hypothetical protein
MDEEQLKAVFKQALLKIVDEALRRAVPPKTLDTIDNVSEYPDRPNKTAILAQVESEATEKSKVLFRYFTDHMFEPIRELRSRVSELERIIATL